MQKSAATAEVRDETAEVVAANLAAIMKANRWTGRSFALAHGLQPVYVQRRASGEVELSASDLRFFADNLSCSVEDFYRPTKDYGSDVSREIAYLADYQKSRPTEAHEAIISTLDLGA